MINISRDGQTIKLNSICTDQARVVIRALGGMSVEEIAPCQSGDAFKHVEGVVTELWETETNKGDKMAHGRLSDGIATIALVIYPRTWAECDQISRGDIVAVSGKVTGVNRRDVNMEMNVSAIKNQFTLKFAY
ncbi:MAG: hypothetical protein AAF485_22350 [Chloroflexota bacterium]